MKINFSKNELIKSINISLKAISNRTTSEILNCIHIRAYNDIFFTTSDEELWIKTKVEGNILTEGEIAVNAKLLSEIVRKLPNDDILFEVINNVAKISSGKSKFKIPCMEINGYNDIPSIDESYKVILNGYTFKEMIRKTIFCTSQTESHQIQMSGEYIEIENDKMKITALDGSRIAIYNTKLENNYSKSTCIVPAKTLNEISKIVKGDTDEKLEMVITDKHFLVYLSETIILSKLITGEYFDINRMLSPDYEIKVTVDRNELINPVDRSLLLIKESDNQPLIINIDEQLLLKIKSKLGEMNEEISISKENDKKLKFGVNPRFLLETLKVIDDENIDMYFINNVAPLFIKDNEKYTYILLPVNFVEEN